MTRDDFKIRKTGSVFYIWQRIGSGFERLSDPHPDRAAANAWITGVLSDHAGRSKCRGIFCRRNRQAPL